MKREKGITLIALVITIIVLLILAGVTIATLLEDNGIITRATTAKNKTQEAGTVEIVQVEVVGSYAKDGNIDINKLNNNLKNNIPNIKLNGQKISEGNKIQKLPAIVTLDGLEIVIENNGNVSVKVTIAEAKTEEKVFKENKTVIDPFGNAVVIPAGFKIASDSAEDVTGGIVIEDATYDKTKGSQFVWIPVGDVYTDKEQTEGKKKTIELKRYVFNENGEIDETLSKTEPNEELKINSQSKTYYTEGLKDATTKNKHAKDIEAFRRSATNNHGYYIGRYEARKGENDNLTEVSTDKVYNVVNQLVSAEKSQSMYNNGKFISDLMNSYAWNTAIVFEQTFDDRENITPKYSRQKSLNTENLASTGTNNLNDSSQQDKICNIWDMASNYWEWTTETFSNSEVPCVGTGGVCSKTINYTSFRNQYDTSHANVFDSFRPILYL